MQIRLQIKINIKLNSTLVRVYYAFYDEFCVAYEVHIVQ